MSRPMGLARMPVRIVGAVCGAVAAFGILVPGPARSAEPALEDLRSHLKKEWLSVGALLQIVADVQPERSLPGSNGFSVANLRVSAGGTLDGGFGYFLQTSFTSSPALLDGRLSYRAGPSLTVDAGAMKAPFSAEFLLPASGIDFVNRSQVVSTLAPARQIGVNVRGALGASPASYAVGVFNGNGVRANGNDGDGVLGVARIALEEAGDSGRVQFGLSAAFGREDGIRVGPVNNFVGDRLLYGADVRLEKGRWMGAGEFIRASLDQDVGATVEPWGYHGTAGVHVSGSVQVLARLDALDPGTGAWDRWIVLGLNWWPTEATEIQVNVLVPEEEADRFSQLLVNAQIGF